MAVNEMHESWITGSGLPDDIDITITDCRWEFTEAGTNDDGSERVEQCRTVFTYTDEENEEGELFLNTGKGWEPGAKGESVVRDDGKPKGKFTSTGAFGYWIGHAAELDGVSEYMGKADTTKAATWIGTKWHIVRDKIEQTMRGQKVEYERVRPSAFLNTGKKGKGKAAPTSTASTNGPKSDASEDVAESGVDNSVPSGKLLDKITELASEHDNHDDFAAAALELEEVAANTGYTTWVMEEDNYAGLRSE